MTHVNAACLPGPDLLSTSHRPGAAAIPECGEAGAIALSPGLPRGR